MKMFFTGAFEFHYKINQLIIKQMTDIADELSEKANLLLCHSLNAHQIWNSRITHKKSLGVFDIYPLNDCINLNKSNLETTKFILQNRDLQEIISYQNSKGIAYKNNIQDILYHVLNHYAHHRGQLVTELKQEANSKPIISDYIYYKRTEK